MPDFIHGVKQAHLPEAHLPDQAKLPGDETRFFKQGASSKGGGDWMSELGNAAVGALEKAITGTVDFAIQGVKDIAKAPVDLAVGTAKGIGGGLAAIAQGVIQGIKDASSTPQQQQPREKPAQQKNAGQHEAKSQPKMRPTAETKKDYDNRAQPTQNREQPQRPESGVKAHESKEPAKAEPTMRATAESARDVAARSAPSNAPQAGLKEVHAPAVRQNHAPALKAITAPNQEKAWAAPSIKVSGEKVADSMIKQSVDSILKDIRATNEISKEKTQENVKAPDKSPERTR